MIRLTPEWTDAHRALLPLLLVLAIGTASAVASAPLQLAVGLTALLLMAAVASLAVEPSIGVTIGIGFAAAGVVLTRVLGDWQDANFVPGLIHAVSCISIGLLAGPAGKRLGAKDDGLRSPVAVATPHTALGLLGAGLGELRLEEELERGRHFGRPVSVMRLQVLPRRSLANDPNRQALMYRAVARQVESVVRITDIPFMYDSADIVVVLPETDSDGAIQTARRVGLSLRSCSFGVRPFGQRIRLADYVDIALAVCSASDDEIDAAAMLVALGAALGDWQVMDTDDPYDGIALVTHTGNPPEVEWHRLRGEHHDRPPLRLIGSGSRAMDRPDGRRTLQAGRSYPDPALVIELQSTIARSTTLAREAGLLRGASGHATARESAWGETNQGLDESLLATVLDELSDALVQASQLAQALEPVTTKVHEQPVTPIQFVKQG